MKHAPEQTASVTLDGVEFDVTYKVNLDRPHDEPPDVYDVTYTVKPNNWIAEAIRQELADAEWIAEAKSEREAWEARMDGPEYDPDEPRTRL